MLFLVFLRSDDIVKKIFFLFSTVNYIDIHELKKSSNQYGAEGMQAQQVANRLNVNRNTISKL